MLDCLLVGILQKAMGIPRCGRLFMLRVASYEPDEEIIVIYIQTKIRDSFTLDAINPREEFVLDCLNQNIIFADQVISHCRQQYCCCRKPLLTVNNLQNIISARNSDNSSKEISRLVTRYRRSKILE